MKIQLTLRPSVIVYNQCMLYDCKALLVLKFDINAQLYFGEIQGYMLPVFMCYVTNYSIPGIKIKMSKHIMYIDNLPQAVQHVFTPQTIKPVF